MDRITRIKLKDLMKVNPKRIRIAKALQNSVDIEKISDNSLE